MEFRTRASAFALCLSIAGSAHAADSGFYFGVSVGQADFNASSSDVAPALLPIIAFGPPAGVVPAPSEAFVYSRYDPVEADLAAFPPVAGVMAIPADVEFHHVDRTLLATVGYQINPFVAAELSYADLGTVEMQISYPLFLPFPSLTPSTLHQTTEIDVTGIQLALLGRWPITPAWSVFGKVGYFFADADIDRSLRVTGSSSTTRIDSPKIASENVLLGAGVEFVFASKWSARLEYQRHIETGGEAFFDEPDVDTISVGVFFHL